MREPELPDECGPDGKRYRRQAMTMTVNRKHDRSGGGSNRAGTLRAREGVDLVECNSGGGAS
jgi:hypothetical protein